MKKEVPMMKTRVLYCFIIISFLIALPVLSYGQHEMVIPSATGPDDFLNDHVLGDTLATGERADLDRVYVLERDGLYVVNASMRLRGWDMRMKAEEGAGALPKIYSLKNAGTGNLTDNVFIVDLAGGNIWLKDLIFCGIIEADTSQIHNVPTGIILVQTAGFRITVDNCVMTQIRGQHIRVEKACTDIKLTNNLFANMGDIERSDLGAGKVIDIRDTSCDTLLFINNTFVNLQDRVIRHRASVGAIEHLIFDHNTIINDFSFHGALALGWMGTEAIITNNLWMDAFVAGEDTDGTRQAEFNESGEKDEYGLAAMNWIFTNPSLNSTVTWKVSGNYYAVSADVQTFYDSHAAEGVKGEAKPLTHHINGKLGADSLTAFTKEAITLVNCPEPMTNMGDWYRNPTWGANKKKSRATFVRTRDDYDRRSLTYMLDTLDASYSTSTSAYTGAQGGFPVGDLNWYPAKKAEWETWLTDVEYPYGVVSNFNLEQNYPNPFNPVTTIKFSIDRVDRVKLEIYNITGQKISTLINQNMKAGEYEVEWNASQVASGVYFYKFSYGSLTMTKKMVLIR